MIDTVSMFNMRGRRALITGSTRGIGRQIAQTFSASGAEVIMHGVREERDSSAAVSELGGHPECILCLAI